MVKVSGEGANVFIREGNHKYFSRLWIFRVRTFALEGYSLQATSADVPLSRDTDTSAGKRNCQAIL